MNIKQLVKQILMQKENKQYQRRLQDKTCTYAEWLRQQEAVWEQTEESFSESSSGKTAGRGTEKRKSCQNPEIVLIYANEGNPASYATKNIARYFIKHPQTQLLYGDEDRKTADGQLEQPDFKPDWSPDLLDTCFYFGSLVALRGELFDRLSDGLIGKALVPCCREAVLSETTVKQENLQEKDGIKQTHTNKIHNKQAVLQQTEGKAEKSLENCVGKSEAYPKYGIREYQVADRETYLVWIRDVVKRLDGYHRNARQIAHLPQILFHADLSREEQDAPWWKQSYPAMGLAMETERVPLSITGVSVIIPSKDHPEILESCLQAVCRQKTERLSIEIIVVDNGSSKENKKKTEQLLSYLKTQAGEQLKLQYIYQKMAFNFSKMCNLGAKQAAGELLLFLNDDVELVKEDCLEKMAAAGARAYTGAVGIKLYYPQSQRIQHVGITNLPMGPVHKLQFWEEGKPCSQLCQERMTGSRNYLAVTAACLMVEKRKFQEIGGFSEKLQVSFNDVDLCYSLYEAGYANVCLADVYAYHYESLSRGEDESGEKLARLLRERDMLYGRHPALKGKDPYYSPYFNREGLDTGIRAVYETLGNQLQKVTLVQPVGEKTKSCREDPCVMLRVESVIAGEITGWCVVLGDNNACYSKELLLRKLQKEKTEASETVVFAIPLQEQYRPDLEQNMKDQKNAALSGFHLFLEKGSLEKGCYQIGIAVKNRVTGQRLQNWSNRTLDNRKKGKL